MELSRKTYSCHSTADHWEELWEAGPYYERISQLAETAQKYLIFVGWQIDSRLVLRTPEPTQGTRPRTLQSEVLRLCERNPDLHVYFLVWDHAYYYMTERQLWQGRIWDQIHPRVHFVFDNRHPFGASHHEKLCIVDGEVALCGGIDLCDDRWDSPDHLFHDPRRSLDGRQERHGPYHDLAVQVSGPICRELLAHVRDRWEALSSIPFPAAARLNQSRVPSEKGHAVYLSRTRASLGAAGHAPIRREIEFLFQEMIRSARSQIILEGQYFWSVKLCELLLAKIHEKRDSDFRLIIVLADLRDVKSPTRAMVDHELELIEKIEKAAAFARISLFLGTPYVHQTGKPSRPVYIHSKLLIVDDRYLSIGSANFATRALRLDTEVNLTLEARAEPERAHIRSVCRQVETHWNIPAKPGECGGERLTSAIQLRSFSSQLREPLRGRKRPGTFLRGFFDPELPWFHLLKRRLLRLRRKTPFLASLAVPLICSVALALVLDRLESALHLPWDPWTGIYCAILGTVAIRPVPFVLVFFLAALQLGPEKSTLAAITSIWVGASLAYLFGRAYPELARRHYRDFTSRELDRKLGERTFESLLLALCDPSASLHAKFGGIGRHFIPLPWVLLSCGLLLPAASSLAARGIAQFSPLLLRQLVANHPLAWVFLALFLCSRGISFKSLARQSSLDHFRIQTKEIKWKDTA